MLSTSSKTNKFLASLPSLDKINLAIDFLGRLLLYVLPLPLLWHLSSMVGSWAYNAILYAYPTVLSTISKFISLVITMIIIWLFIPLAFLAATIAAPLVVPVSKLIIEKLRNLKPSRSGSTPGGQQGVTGARLEIESANGTAPHAQN